MARQRVINPEFFLDEELSGVSAHARLLYIGLWGICDDNYATLPNRPKWIKAQVFPYEEVNIEELIDELEKLEKITRFESEDGKQYWFVKNFFKYQKIDRPSKPKFPEYQPYSTRHADCGTDGERKKDDTRGVLDEHSTSTRAEEKRSKEKRTSILSARADETPFEIFWEKYPRKEQKRKSLEIWARKKLDAQLEAILAFIALAESSDRWKSGYVKQPPSFLSGECWNDDLESYRDKVVSSDPARARSFGSVGENIAKRYPIFRA